MPGAIIAIVIQVRVILLSVILERVILMFPFPCVILLSVNMPWGIRGNVILMSVILLDVIFLNAILQNAILLNVGLHN